MSTPQPRNRRKDYKDRDPLPRTIDTSTIGPGAIGDVPKVPVPSPDSLVARIRGEYREMPGLRLTVAQACRLWQVDAATCETLLSQLVTEAFLYKTDNGAYIVQSPTGQRRQAKAELRQPVSLPRTA